MCIIVTVLITIIDYVGRHWIARSSVVILMLTISRKWPARKHEGLSSRLHLATVSYTCLSTEGTFDFPQGVRRIF